MSDIPTAVKKGKVYYLVHFPVMDDQHFRDQYARIRWWHQNVAPWLSTCTGGWHWFTETKMLGFGDPREAVRFKLTWHDHRVDSTTSHL